MFAGQRLTPRYAFADFTAAEASYALANKIACRPDDPAVRQHREPVTQQPPEPHICWDVTTHTPPAGMAYGSVQRLPTWQPSPNFAPKDFAADTRLPPRAAAGARKEELAPGFEPMPGKREPYTATIDPKRFDEDKQS